MKRSCRRLALAFCLATCLVPAASASATTAPVPGLPAAALAVMNQAPYANGQWFISVRDIETGQQLISLNSDANPRRHPICFRP